MVYRNLAYLLFSHFLKEAGQMCRSPGLSVVCSIIPLNVPNLFNYAVLVTFMLVKFNNIWISDIIWLNKVFTFQ